MLFISRLTVVALAAGAVLSFTSIASAQTTYYVNGSCGDDSWTGLSPICEAPDGPKATIQAGIDAGDHFDSVEVADGIYRGPGNKNLEFFTKEMSIHSAGGPTNCIIDCENDGFGFTFCTLPDDRPVTIEGFTIRNGRHHFAGGICITAAEVTIDNCIIEHCVGTGEGTSDFGGGILINRSPVLITGTIIRSNTAGGVEAGRGGNGGGIHVSDISDIRIEDCVIEDNEAIADGGYPAGSAGGGLYASQYARIRMTRSMVIGNRAVAMGFSTICRGGGVYIWGGFIEPSEVTDSAIVGNELISQDPTGTANGGGASIASDCIVRDCRISGNSARSGGGLSIGEGVQLFDVLISDNTAELDGGGIWAQYLGGLSDIFRVRLVHNAAGRDGGGAYCHNTTLTLCESVGNFAGRDGGGLAGTRFGAYQSVISRNYAARNGGGVYADRGVSPGSSLVIQNAAGGAGGGVFIREQHSNTLQGATIVGNTSQTGGGGLHIESVYIESDRLVTNSIIRGNAPVSLVDVSGDALVERSNVEGGWPGVGNLDVDPRFVDPANDDYRLLAGSPCIDAGDNRQSTYDFDLGGAPRRVDDRGVPDSGVRIGAIVDIGAYEFQGTSTGFIAVHPRPGVAGQDNQLQVAGATPGNVVYFVYGFATGSTGVPGCPGVNVEIANPRIAAQATADGSGYASSVIGIPGAAAGRAIVLQAVDHNACGVSNVVGYRFP